MKKSKNFLILFLIFSFILFGFSNVKADEFTSVIGTGSSYYKSNSQFVANFDFTNKGYITIPVGQYFKFNSVKMTQPNLLSCDGTTKIYRVDFILWGWHNQDKTIQDWVNYSQKITLNSGTYTFLKPNLLGSIVQPENGYRIKVSTFVSYNMLEEKDCGSGLKFDLIVNLLFNDSANDKYFLDTRPGTENEQTLYYTIENIYNVSSTEEVNALLTSYYSGNLITQEKLDNISSSIDNVTDKIAQTNEKLEDIYSDITNNDISGSQNTANGFFDNFSDNDYGLSSIITIPLASIQKITNATCTPINIPIPFTKKDIDLPCMSSLYEQNVPSLLNIWQIVSFGLISYRIIVDIFGLVKKFKDPNDDKLEVIDL